MNLQSNKVKNLNPLFQSQRGAPKFSLKMMLLGFKKTAEVCMSQNNLYYFSCMKRYWTIHGAQSADNVLTHLLTIRLKMLGLLFGWDIKCGMSALQLVYVGKNLKK